MKNSTIKQIVKDFPVEMKAVLMERFKLEEVSFGRNKDGDVICLFTAPDESTRN